MKKKILLVVLCAFILTGCKSETAETPVATATPDQPNNTIEATSESTELSIQDEIAHVELLHQANYDAAQKCETQLEMNENAAEDFQIWDDELNSLWSRLSDLLDADTKEKVLNEQREWIKRKELAVKEAGLAVEGGTMQPLLEYCKGADLTRVRVYELAALLADVHGESFVISSEIQDELAELDPSVDQVFAKYEGTYYTDENQEGYIKIEKIENSDIMADGLPEGTKWVVTYPRGVVLTDTMVVGYTSDSITFEVEGYYYQLRENIAGNVELGGGAQRDDTYEFVISEW